MPEIQDQVSLKSSYSDHDICIWRHLRIEIIIACSCFALCLLLMSSRTCFVDTVADSGLFNKIKFENHCLHHLLPKVHEVVSYNLRGRPTRYDLPKVTFTKLWNSFIYRCAKWNYQRYMFTFYSFSFHYYYKNPHDELTYLVIILCLNMHAYTN